ncbi:MAG: zinc-ribbon domain-containing protein, partial [Butyrivibrio sp.]|nr:zinc-ribbon domain-containing protein [Butyrivibrio sp.]
MFCLKCGKEIENNAVFCPFCGGKQPKASWVEPSEPARTPEPGTEPHTERTPEPGTELHTARTPEPGTEQQTARTPEPGTKPQAAPDRAEPAPSASNKFERIIETGCGAIGLALLITAVMRPVAWVLKSIPFQSLFRALPGWDLMPYAAQDFIIRMPNPFSLLGSVLSG